MNAKKSPKSHSLLDQSLEQDLGEDQSKKTIEEEKVPKSEGKNSSRKTSKRKRMSKGVKVSLIPLNSSVKGMMNHLKVSPFINLVFKNSSQGRTTITDVVERLKTKQWDNLLTNSKVVFYKKLSSGKSGYTQLKTDQVIGNENDISIYYKINIISGSDQEKASEESPGNTKKTELGKYYNMEDKEVDSFVKMCSVMVADLVLKEKNVNKRERKRLLKSAQEDYYGKEIVAAQQERSSRICSEVSGPAKDSSNAQKIETGSCSDSESSNSEDSFKLCECCDRRFQAYIKRKEKKEEKQLLNPDEFFFNKYPENLEYSEVSHKAKNNLIMNTLMNQ